MDFIVFHCPLVAILIKLKWDEWAVRKRRKDGLAIKFRKGCMQRASFLFRSKDGMIPGTLLQFSYSELENATNKFSESNLIGMGGSNYVYCGHLKDGGTVAIKRMKAQEGPNAESDFLTEIELISRLHHCHVVPLSGFCSENQGKRVERLLVFEYMPNGYCKTFMFWWNLITIGKLLVFLHDGQEFEAGSRKIFENEPLQKNGCYEDSKFLTSCTPLSELGLGQ
ncbi:hypothetical protein POM88_010327 [Heracleum sosnowskyi]|uniref:Protein kinase domain-containing protein n=1 Tax=Heracleum sosnowskyi TaxID=360622 RepID=A0AAD8IUW0_9APIA|nr:hypothetical protein POM88_010327 [Heracleum sosnowskyi]